MKNVFSTGEVARILKIQPYRIEYALATGLVREPGRVFNKRAFRRRDLLALAEHFGITIHQHTVTSVPKEQKND